MGISIGNNNTFTGSVNIGDHAQQIINQFQSQFDTLDKILDLLEHELNTKYTDSDKNEILKNYRMLKGEMLKCTTDRDKTTITKCLSIVSKGFSFIANSSSIAGLAIALLNL